jgi:hypothetical protein
MKVHDCGAGVMVAFGSVVERIGVHRRLPGQTLTLNRRPSGVLLNSLLI